MSELSERWIPHSGKGRPHPPETEVFIKRRNGRVEGPGCSAFIGWVNDDEPDDVVAWRAATKVEIRVRAFDHAAKIIERFGDHEAANAIRALASGDRHE